MKGLATVQLRACSLLSIALAMQNDSPLVVLVQLLVGLFWESGLRS